MAPKFRGNSDDWLDNQNSKHHGKSKGIRPKKSVEARSLGLDPETANGTVIEVYPNQCRVKSDSTGEAPLCSYRRAEVVSKSKTNVRERTPVAVGDRVLISQTGSQDGVVEGICARKNSLSRPVPGKESEKLQHVLAANVDVLVIVASVRDPVFSSGLVDRFLVAAEYEKISTVLAITKVDLIMDVGKEVPWQLYRDLGYSVVETSVKTDRSLESLLSQIVEKRVVFCGHSGVGKTSLLRGLLGSSVGRVGQVNEMTGKGRHTTTGAVLLGGPGESQWIDTPGIRAFGLLNIPPESLYLYFPEFRELVCPTTSCIHRDEEGCLAQNLPRYSSYRRILESLLEGEH